jgi:hypothetical protein
MNAKENKKFWYEYPSPVFGYLDDEDAFVKIIGEGEERKHFVKFPQKKEREIAHDNKLLNDVLLYGKAITEKEYNEA